MPKITELTSSDDEYEDAFSDVDNGNIAMRKKEVNDNVASFDALDDENFIQKLNDSHIATEEDSAKANNTSTTTYPLNFEEVNQQIGHAEGGAKTEEDSEKATTYASNFEEINQTQTDWIPPDGSDKNYAEQEGEVEELKPELIDEDIDEKVMREKEETLTFEELEANKEKAINMKLEANELFKNDKSMDAIEIYTEALKICPTKYSKERAILYGNRAAAKIKIDSKKSAIEDCSKAIELWPDYVRALLRRAKLFELDDKLDEALKDYKRVYELEPGQREACEAMIRLPPLIDERNERLKEEMLGKLKDLGNMILKPFGLSTSNFQMQKDPTSGSYSINFNQNSS
uniref:Tetratricopeptide repeat protein 1 n=1 Tax=Glossina pallidipes TaxID=7398 RepID=A0A1A9ZAD0_GLOPL